MNIDIFRRRHLAMAELLDAWRVVPRLLVTAYSYLVWDTVQWFQHIPEPTTQHTALVSAIVGASAIVFGAYTNSGHNWKEGFVLWDQKKALEVKTPKTDKPAAK